MPTDTDLVNDALGLVGQDQINSLQPGLNNKVIPVALRALPRVKRAALRARDWNSARARAQLIEVTNTSGLDNLKQLEWTHAYRAPSDCLCIRRFIGPWERHRRHHYSLERDENGKQVIFCNLNAPVGLVYTREQLDPNMYDALLYDAVVRRLASDLAASWARDFKLAAGLLQTFAIAFDEAVGADEAEGGIEQEHSLDLLDVRLGGTPGMPTNVPR